MIEEVESKSTNRIESENARRRGYNVPQQYSRQLAGVQIERNCLLLVNSLVS